MTGLSDHDGRNTHPTTGWLRVDALVLRQNPRNRGRRCGRQVRVGHCVVRSERAMRWCPRGASGRRGPRRRRGAAVRTEPSGGPRVFCQRCGRRRSGRAAFVAMMQSADRRQRHHPSCIDRRDRSRLRSILPERQVRTRAMVVVDVGAEQASQVSRVEHDHVVETLAAHRADQAFHVRIVPRRPRRRSGHPSGRRRRPSGERHHRRSRRDHAGERQARGADLPASR